MEIQPRRYCTLEVRCRPRPPFVCQLKQLQYWEWASASSTTHSAGAACNARAPALKPSHWRAKGHYVCRHYVCYNKDRAVFFFFRHYVCTCLPYVAHFRRHERHTRPHGELRVQRCWQDDAIPTGKACVVGVKIASLVSRCSALLRTHVDRGTVLQHVCFTTKTRDYNMCAKAEAGAMQRAARQQGATHGCKFEKLRATY